MKTKFRAWDSHLKVMIENIHKLDAFNEYVSRCRYIEEQFIGTDKNKIELFVGDIVKMHVSLHTHCDYSDKDINIQGYYVGEVRLIPSMGACLYNPIYYDFDRDEPERMYMYKNIAFYRSEKIGNIHKNPELLTK